MTAVKTRKTLPGLRKAAIVIASLPKEEASRLLCKLGPEVARAIGLELARLSELPDELIEAVLKEFLEAVRAGRPVLREGLEGAKELIRSAFPPGEAEAATKRLDEAVRGRPFGFLAEVEPAAILAQLREEQPQTIAVVLAHLAPRKAAQVLEGLPPKLQGEVARRIARLSDISAEAIKQIEEVLASRFRVAPVFSSGSALGQGGPELASEILRWVSRRTERSAIDAIEDESPELAEEIRRRLFSFEDLLQADDSGIRALLKEVSTQELCVALKTASDELKAKFLSNLSRRARELLEEEMEYMRPVRLSEVEAAQMRILDAARRLEESGELFVAGRASGEDYVV